MIIPLAHGPFKSRTHIVKFHIHPSHPWVHARAGEFNGFFSQGCEIPQMTVLHIFSDFPSCSFSPA